MVQLIQEENNIWNWSSREGFQQCFLQFYYNSNYNKGYITGNMPCLYRDRLVIPDVNKK